VPVTAVGTVDEIGAVMRGFQAVEEKVRATLAEGEKAVRTIRARRGWLVLTDRRVLVLGPAHHGRPPGVIADEPLATVHVEDRWLWSKLERRLVIRGADGRRRQWGLARAKGQRTRWDQSRVMNGFAADVHHWTTVAEIIAEQVATGQTVDVDLAHVHATALDATTPADLARALALDPHRVRDLLRERFGVTVSKGAGLRYSYTRDDRRRFDTAVKEKLFAALVDEVGAEQLVVQARSVAHEWWENDAMEGVESALGLLDVSLTHVAQRRAPIARWQSTFLWIGFAFAAVTALLVVPPLVWRSSWDHWRDGSQDRPVAAIAMGVGAVALVGALVVGSIAANVLS
jgi:hypothetical protein